MALLRRISKFHIAMVTTFFVILMYIAREIQNTHHQPPGGYPDLPSNVNKRQQPSPNYHDSDPEDMVHFKKDVPLIWIGGVPRSGTTLMRAMLDAHPDIRCGEETRVIPRILGMHVGMSKTPIEVTRLQEAKITNEILDSAMGAYILSIIAMHGEPAPRLCNKDPFTLRSMQRLLRIFPNSKFIFMVRDGRATVHSIISRKVTIKGFDNHSYRGGLRDWNRAISTMHGECLAVGTSRCLLVHYEQLVLHPEAELRRVLDFLDVSWNEVVLHHERTIGQTGGVSLSKKELSTDQVDKPVNLGALTKWIDYIPLDVRGEMRSLAPMLETLGYNPDAYPPFYGTPDKSVLKQSEALNLNKPPGPKVTPPEKDNVVMDKKNLPEEAHFAMGNRERL